MWPAGAAGGGVRPAVAPWVKIRVLSSLVYLTQPHALHLISSPCGLSIGPLVWATFCHTLSLIKNDKLGVRKGRGGCLQTGCTLQLWHFSAAVKGISGLGVILTRAFVCVCLTKPRMRTISNISTLSIIRQPQHVPLFQQHRKSQD